MDAIILFDNIALVEGDSTLSDILSNLSQREDFRRSFPMKVSAGWYTRNGRQYHYVDIKAVAWIGAHLCVNNRNFYMRTCRENEYAPIETMEPWSLPENTDEAIVKGYLTAPKDFHFCVPYNLYHRFGAWRQNEPVI